MALSPEEKHEREVNRVWLNLRTMSIGKVFNAHPNGIAVLFQKLVRMKAADAFGYCVCITCGVRQHWKDMDTGHYIGRTNKATILDEKNTAPQCKNCNHWNNGAKEVYRLRLIELYGIEAVEELESRKLPKNHVWDRRELAELKIRLRKEIKEMEARS